LHATVRLPGVDEDALRAEAARRRIAFETMRDYDQHDGPLTLLLGYAPLPEPTIRAGVGELRLSVPRDAN